MAIRIIWWHFIYHTVVRSSSSQTMRDGSALIIGGERQTEGFLYPLVNSKMFVVTFAVQLGIVNIFSNVKLSFRSGSQPLLGFSFVSLTSSRRSSIKSRDSSISAWVAQITKQLQICREESSGPQLMFNFRHNGYCRGRSNV